MRVCSPGSPTDIPPVRDWQAREREQFVAGSSSMCSYDGKLSAEHGGDDVELGVDVFGVGLAKMMRCARSGPDCVAGPRR